MDTLGLFSFMSFSDTFNELFHSLQNEKFFFSMRAR